MDTPSMAPAEEWLSFHVADHSGNRDQLLTDLVRPTVRALWQEGKLASFFFLRHALGGPHIRLRIRPSPGSREVVRETVQEQVESYLGDSPSPARADSSIAEIPFEPEIERYGEGELMGKSLDFFALTSTRALVLLGHRSTVPVGEWLTIALRLEARHVLGFADSIGELESLLVEPRASSGAGPDFILERADRTFQESGDRLVRLLRQEVERLGLAALSPLEDGEEARCLGRELAGVERAMRLRIFAGQIHMTANRLGLATVEETYVARILWRTFRRLEEADPGTWSDLGDLLTCRAAREPSPARRLSDLLALAFATL